MPQSDDARTVPPEYTSAADHDCDSSAASQRQRRQGACLHLVRDHTAVADQHPPDHPEVSRLETWISVRARCRVCDFLTVADRYLNTRAGPGWRCSHDSSHYWAVRTHPLLPSLSQNPPEPSYP
jgi:hypothetical protein